MSRIFAIVVVAAVLVGGIVAVDVASQTHEPADANDSDVQQDVLSVFADGYSIAQVIPFVLMVALAVGALGVFRGL